MARSLWCSKPTEVPRSTAQGGLRDDGGGRHRKFWEVRAIQSTGDVAGGTSRPMGCLLKTRDRHKDPHFSGPQCPLLRSGKNSLAGSKGQNVRGRQKNLSHKIDNILMHCFLKIKVTAKNVSGEQNSKILNNNGT